MHSAAGAAATALLPPSLPPPSLSSRRAVVRGVGSAVSVCGTLAVLCHDSLVSTLAQCRTPASPGRVGRRRRRESCYGGAVVGEDRGREREVVAPRPARMLPSFPSTGYSHWRCAAPAMFPLLLLPILPLAHVHWVGGTSLYQFHFISTYQKTRKYQSHRLPLGRCICTARLHPRAQTPVPLPSSFSILIRF